jgi:hypothetical protein
VGELSDNRFFLPNPLKFREAVHEGGDDGFMVFAVKPCPMPSPKRRLHWKIEKATERMSLKPNGSDNLSATSAWLIIQKEVVFK